jgi:hypothetical protein
MGQPYPGPWTFNHHPWLREMHDSEAGVNVGQKSAQMGYTENVLNLTFYNIDVRNIDCLYVLPAKTPDASDFSAARFDPALELSPHLSKIFSEVKNVGHKRAGTTNLYIRGSRSRAGLKSVPVGFLVLDEVDEMTEENIPLALERQSGQVEKSTWMVSTATIEDRGINTYFKESSQNHFHFRCPCCSRMTELVFPESIVITAEQLDDPRVKDSHLICKECKGRLEHKDKVQILKSGLWVPSYLDRDSQGWYINQLYSSTVSPVEIATSYLKAQVDEGHAQEFHNSKLGLPYAPDGSQLTDRDLEQCISDYTRGQSAHLGHLRTMGVDVGKSWLHFEIDQWMMPTGNIPGGDLNIATACRVLTYGKVREFEELDELMRQFDIHFAVIDIQPERRKVLEFCNRWYGHAMGCFYPNGISGKSIHKSEEELVVNVDRTSWLDLSLGRVRRGKPYMHLPKDMDYEYRSQLKALTRITRPDQNKNPIGMYVKKDKVPDHYAHARNYAEIALPLAASLGVAKSISSPV